MEWTRGGDAPVAPMNLLYLALLFLCQVHAAYVRESHWSGKTLEPLEEAAPQILSFLGSQRFGSVQVQRTAP